MTNHQKSQFIKTNYDILFNAANQELSKIKPNITKPKIKTFNSNQMKQYFQKYAPNHKYGPEQLSAFYDPENKLIGIHTNLSLTSGDILNSILHELWHHFERTRPQVFPPYKCPTNLYFSTKPYFINQFRKSIPEYIIPKIINYLFSPKEIWANIFSEAIMKTPIHVISHHYIQKFFNINTQNISNNIK